MSTFRQTTTYVMHRWIADGDDFACVDCGMVESHWDTLGDDGPLRPCLGGRWIGDGFAAYLACALWSSTDDDGQPLDARFDVDDFGDVAELQSDWDSFARDNAHELIDLDASQCGHDFWLTRNHHGAGFWDRGLGKRGKDLTTAAQAYGDCELHVGDDGRVWS